MTYSASLVALLAKVTNAMMAVDDDVPAMLNSVLEGKQEYFAYGLLKAIEAVAEGGLSGGQPYGWPRATLAFVELCSSSRPFNRLQLERFARAIKPPEETAMRLSGRWQLLIGQLQLDEGVTQEQYEERFQALRPHLSPFFENDARRQLADFQLQSPEWKAARERLELGQKYLMDRLTTGKEVFR